MAAYGSPVTQLAQRFQVHRITVVAHLQCHDLPRRPMFPKLSDDDLDQAARLYGDGRSLAFIAQGFGVNPKTVGRALRRTGIEIRPRRGWTDS